MSAMRWSTALGTALDVRPITRLFVAWRGALAACLSLSWGLALGWVGYALRIGAQPPDTAAGEHALLAACLAVAVPATVGVCVGEAVQELLRRPMTVLLPGLRARLRASALVLGSATALATALLVRLERDADALHALAALALSGYAAGLWLLLRIGSGWFWLARAALVLALVRVADSLLAGPLTSSAGAALAVLVSVAVIGLRFARPLARLGFASAIPTVFSSAWSHRVDRDAARRELARAPARTAVALPPQRLGGSLAGWERAWRFEHGGLLGHWLLLAVVAIAVGLTIASGMLATDGSFAERWKHGLEQAFLGLVGWSGDSVSAAPRNPSHFVAFSAAAVATLGCQPVVQRIFLPIGRELRARLALRIAIRTSLVGTSLIGLAAGGSALVLGIACAGTWPAGLPVFARVLLLMLVATPWFQLAARALGSKPPLNLALAIGAALILADLGRSSLLAAPSAALVAGALALHVAGWIAVARYLARHFRTQDLRLG